MRGRLHAEQTAPALKENACGRRLAYRDAAHSGNSGLVPASVRLPALSFVAICLSAFTLASSRSSHLVNALCDHTHAQIKSAINATNIMMLAVMLRLTVVTVRCMLVGYARVSTSEQETRLQLDALRKAGVRRVFSEKGSGVGPRYELQRALQCLRPGDVLVVYKLDRLARSLKDLLALLDRLRLMGCAVRSLTEPVDTSSAIGELVLQILGAVAQFERSLIRERCEAGRRAAVARGVKFGRSVLLEEQSQRTAAEFYRMGLSYREIAVVFGVSYTAARSAVQRARLLV
jgi:DNA invertase Pin-like site-specific DNA recombinase